jgi:hypothetical protein
MRRGVGGTLSECRPGSVEPDPGKPVKPHQLDQRPDLRLGPPQQDRAPARPQTAGQHGEVEHQRGVGEHQFAQVDDDVGLGPERPRDRGAAEALGRAVLIAADAEYRRVGIEVDDAGNLPNPTRLPQGPQPE